MSSRVAFASSLLSSIVFTGLVATASQALAARGGNAEVAQACAEDGWRSWFTRQGEPFKNAGECTSHGAKGGVMIPGDALQCLADGWKGRYTDGGVAIADEEACVTHVVGGGQFLSGPALQCLTDGWKGLYQSADGAAFAAEQACVTYAVGGGTFLVIDPRCTNGETSWLVRQDGSRFTDERACSVYTNGGGVLAGIKITLGAVANGMLSYTIKAIGMMPFNPACNRFGCGGRLELYIGRGGASYSAGGLPIGANGTYESARSIYCRGASYLTANGHTAKGTQITAATMPIASCP